MYIYGWAPGGERSEYVYVYISMYVCMCVCVFVCMYVWTYTYVCICTDVHVRDVPLLQKDGRGREGFNTYV